MFDLLLAGLGRSDRRCNSGDRSGAGRPHAGRSGEVKEGAVMSARAQQKSNELPQWSACGSGVRCESRIAVARRFFCGGLGGLTSFRSASEASHNPSPFSLINHTDYYNHQTQATMWYRRIATEAPSIFSTPGTGSASSRATCRELTQAALRFVLYVQQPHS